MYAGKIMKRRKEGSSEGGMKEGVDVWERRQVCSMIKKLENVRLFVLQDLTFLTFSAF